MRAASPRTAGGPAERERVSASAARFYSLAANLASGQVSGLPNQPFDDHAVAPGAVEATVALVGADLAEAERAAQAAAGGVLREDPGHQLREPRLLAGVEQAHERGPPGAGAAGVATDVHGEL